MEATIIEILSKDAEREVPLSEIVSAFPDTPKKDINSALYKLKGKGLAEKFAEANGTKPRWKLIKPDPSDIEARIAKITEQIKNLQAERDLLLGNVTPGISSTVPCSMSLSTLMSEIQLKNPDSDFTL